MPAGRPDSYPNTREALHALACYVVAPYRKARTGRIGLRPVDGGFGTPPFDDGSRIVVVGDRLERRPGAAAPITTLRAGAAFLEVELTADPGVGRDLPDYEPDRPLDVDPAASAALGAWYALGQGVLDTLARRLAPSATMSEAQLWPEHFDLASQVRLAGGAEANVGFSPGDGFCPEPYVYLGPFEREGLTGGYWNAPFGGYRTDVDEAGALEFLTAGLDLLAAREDQPNSTDRSAS